MKLLPSLSFKWSYLSIWIILLLFAYIPFFGNFIRTPSQLFYYGADDIAIDLTGNIATVRQGYENDGLGYFNYSTLLPYKPSVLKIEYIVIGKIARLIQLDPAYAIIAARAFLTFGWFILLYNLILSLFTTNTEKITATVLVLFATSITISGFENYATYAIPDTFVFQRFTLAMPHYLLGGLAGFTSLLLLSSYLGRNKSKIIFLLSTIFASISAITYGPVVVLIFTTFPMYLGIRGLSILFKKERLLVVLRESITLLLYSLLPLLVLLYVRWTVSSQWKSYNTYQLEMGNPFSLTIAEYFMAIGGVYLFSLFSLPTTFIKRDPLRILLTSWLLLHPLSIFILAPRLDLNTHRFFLIPYIVPFGLLAVDGIKNIVVFGRKLVPVLPIKSMFLVLTTAVIFSGYNTYTYILKYRTASCHTCVAAYSNYTYVPTDVMKSIFWLRDNTENKESILSQLYAGQLIPAFSGNRVYLSLWFQFIQNEEFYYAKYLTEQFYDQRMSDDEALAFLKEINVSYVFFGDQERMFTHNAYLTYPFLREVYNSGTTRIFKVK